MKEGGITDCIQVERREEGVGLGQENQTPSLQFKWNDQFWTDMYNSNAKKFKGIQGDKKLV